MTTMVDFCGKSVDAETGAALHAMMEEQIKRVVAEHGIAAMAMPKRATCIHEAGHCVVYAADGNVLGNCWVKPTSREMAERISIIPGEHWQGMTNLKDMSFQLIYGPEDPPERCEQVSRATIAGVHAERMFAGEDFHQGSSIDERVLFNLHCQVAAARRGVDVVEVGDRVTAQVHAVLDRYADTVHKIAGLLYRNNKVSGEHMRRLVAHIPPCRFMDEGPYVEFESR